MILIKFLFFFFFIFLILILSLGFSFFRGIKRMFSGEGKQQARRQQRNTTYTNRGNSRDRRPYEDNSSYAEETNDEPRFRPRRKVYGRNEGEYVDYEEVKE